MKADEPTKHAIPIPPITKKFPLIPLPRWKRTIGANLSGAKFDHTNLSGANLSDTDMEYADVSINSTS